MRKSTSVKPINVASAIILRETPNGTRVLVARRKLDALLEPGKWEFPGGKLEPLEHPEACLVREIREELNLEIDVGEIFDVASHIYQSAQPSAQGPIHIILLCYLCRTEQEDFQLLDVSDARWVDSTELSSFEYAAADVATVAKLVKYLNRRTS